MADIFNERRWAHFDLVPRQDKKPAKVPTRKVNQPDTWLTYAEAVATVGRHAGVAVLLGSGLAGIDVDGAALAPDKVAALLHQAEGAYIERSISGAGLHILGRAERLGFELDLRNVPHTCTPWTTTRFFVYLGTGSGDPRHDLTAVIERWCPALAAPSEPAPTGSPRWHFSDEDVVTHAALAANGDGFCELWVGNTEGYASHSEADLGLACILAFWCDSVDQIDRVFRLSALYRPKWEVNTYRGATLRRAAKFIQREAA